MYTCIYIQVKLVTKNVILGGRVPVSKCCVKLNPWYSIFFYWKTVCVLNILILYKKANFNRIAADDGFLLPAGEISFNTVTILKLLGIYKNLSLCIQLNSMGLSKRLLFFRIA